VIAAMNAHMGHECVQGQGCRALGTLAHNNDIEKAIAAEGGISVVLAAMVAHMGDTDVQERICWALGSIGWSDKTLQKKIKKVGGVVVVEAAIKASGANAGCKSIGQTLLDKLRQV